MQIDVKAPLDLTPAEIAGWRALQAESGLLSPYLSPDWMLALARAGGPDARGGRVALIREYGELVGVFPTRVGRFTALPPGSPLCDYQAVVAKPGLQLKPQALAQALGVARLDLYNLVDDQPWFTPHLRGKSESLYIDLAGGFDAYARQRKEAGSGILADAAKKMRKLEREHEAVRFTPSSTSLTDFEQMIACKRAQYKCTRQTDIFDAVWPETLLRNLFTEATPAFGARMFTLHVGDKLAAVNLCLHAGPVLHAWFIAHDEAFQKYSPGVLLFAEILRWAPEQGIVEMDLGPGDYRFKVALANASRQVGHGFVGRLSAASAMRGAQYRVRGAAEALPLGRYSHLPGKAMRRIDLWRGLRSG